MVVEITLIAVFLAGIVSFLSPCVLPLMPGFLAYLAGTSINDTKSNRFKVFLNSAFFVLGFSTVFALLGVLLNTILENIAYDVQLWLSRLGGLVIIFFALYILGLLKLKFLENEYKIDVKRRFNINYINSFIFGAAFAVGWSPCVGAVLGSVLALAITSPGMSFIFLMTYTLGLGLPFLIMGAFTKEALDIIKKSGVFFKYFNIIVGILLLILGILVFTQSLNLIVNFDLLGNYLLK